MKAYGFHVFAGGFTLGVRQVMPVVCQLERHSLGEDTTLANGVPRRAVEEAKSLVADCDVCFGNPRCSGFSTTTGGMRARGPGAPQNADIVELCRVATGLKTPVIIWESVQNAYELGRPLLRRLIAEFFGGYRVAHVFESSASFDSAQHRRRYLFVAYRRGLTFNVTPPPWRRRLTVGEVLTPYLKLIGEPRRLWTTAGKDARDYLDGDYCEIDTDPGKVSVQHLRQGESLYDLARREPRLLSAHHRARWDHPASTLPFGLYPKRRLAWDRGSPTLTTGSMRSLIHPLYDRPLSVREFAALMGWPDGALVRGLLPFAQLAKGVVPAVGEWIATQALHCLSGYWGGDDWESTWDGERWVGTSDTRTRDEKVFNLTSYFEKGADDGVRLRR